MVPLSIYGREDRREGCGNASLLGISLALPLNATAQEHRHMPHADARTVIYLSADERAMVLGEMRGFLSGVQTITDALARDDAKTVAQAAGLLGIWMTRHVPSELHAKLPQQFKQWGNEVHNDFDQIALDAQSFGDTQHSISQLGATLQKCVACHGTYQLQAETAQHNQ